MLLRHVGIINLKFPENLSGHHAKEPGYQRIITRFARFRRLSEKNLSDFAGFLFVFKPRYQRKFPNPSSLSKAIRMTNVANNFEIHAGILCHLSSGCITTSTVDAGRDTMNFNSILNFDKNELYKTNYLSSGQLEHLVSLFVNNGIDMR